MLQKISILFLIFICTFCSSFADTQFEKWDAMATEVNEWGDGLGLPIDDGIKELVIGLNLFQIITRQSCEGHLNWGTPYPWVDFEFAFNHSTIQKLQNKLHLQIEKRDRLEKALKKKYPTSINGDKWTHSEAESMRRDRQECNLTWMNIQNEKFKLLHPLDNLLREFYLAHPCSYDTMLMIKIQNEEGLCELSSHDCDRHLFLNLEQKALKLKEYQNEMKAFGEFLKQKFLLTTAL